LHDTEILIGKFKKNCTRSNTQLSTYLFKLPNGLVFSSSQPPSASNKG